MDFVDALTALYLAHPGALLPNALWKTRQIVDRCQAALELDEAGNVTRLVLSQPERLFLYWHHAGHFDLAPAYLHTLTLALLHDRYAAAFPLDTFSTRERYFRLSYRHDAPAAGSDLILPSGFSIAPVGIAAAPAAAAAQIERFIGRCYDDLHPSAAGVESWRNHPTFVPDLWLWLVDTHHGQPAALGIAEYDPLVAEGALEWIQVLPAYRRRGLGTVLVAELLARLHALGASFTTVSGRFDNAAAPPSLYRRCGFTGDDRWWLLRRDPSRL